MLLTARHAIALALVSVSVAAPASAQRSIESVSLAGYPDGMTIEVAAVSGGSADGRALVREIARWVRLDYRPTAEDDEAIRVSVVTARDGTTVALDIAPPPAEPAALEGLAAIVHQAVVGLALARGRERTTEIVVGRRATGAPSLADLDDAALAARFAPLASAGRPTWMVRRVAVVSPPHLAPHTVGEASVMRVLRHPPDLVGSCYQELLDASGPTVGEGALELELGVAESGEVVAARVTTEPTGVARFASCAASRVRSLRFPATATPREIHARWTLRHRVQRARVTAAQR